MRLIWAILFIMLMLALEGCRTHERQAGATAPDTSVREYDPSGLLAFRQQAEADLVVDFLDWDDITIGKPSPAGAAPALNRHSFLQAVGRLAIQKRLAVVVMDKRWSIASHRVGLDEVEAVMRGLGFERVVFQQARSVINFETGLPILRDTAEQQTTFEKGRRSASD
jgi:hypothetical protein